MANGDERAIICANDDVDACETRQTGRSADDFLKRGDRVLRHQVPDRTTPVVLSSTKSFDEWNAFG